MNRSWHPSLEAKGPLLPEVSTQVHQARYFSFTGDDFDRTPLAITYGGLEICDAAYRIDRPEFPLYTIEIVLSGTGSLALASGDFALSPGSAFIYGPGLPCRIVNHPATPLRKYFVAFRSPITNVLEEFGLSEAHFSQSGPDDGLLPLIDMLFAEGCRAHGDSFRICNAFLSIILRRFARSTTLATKREEPGWQVFSQCRTTIDDNFLQIHQLDDLAAMLGLSPSYISRLFRRYFHTTPYQYLQRRKVDYAEALLREGGLTVAHAAARAGFQDPFHFSRVFKKIKGFCPGHCRHRTSPLASHPQERRRIDPPDVRA